MIHGGEECFATAGDDKAIKIWSLKDYSILMEVYEQNSISSLSYSSILDLLIAGVWGEKPNGYISFWNLRDGKRIN